MALEYFPKAKAAVILLFTGLANMRRRQTKRMRSVRIVFLIFFSLFGLLLTQPGRTQKSVDPPCTVLELRCPSYVVSSTGRITFQADVVGAKMILGDERTRLLAYEWKVTGGKIISGQGTPTLLVKPADTQPGCITVTVRVKGASPECENQKSCVLKIDPRCTRPDTFDKYGDLSFKEEKSHLDNLAKSLTESGPDSTAYILTYAGRNACISEAEWRGNSAKKYLIERHKIPDDRIVLVDAGFRETLTTELFLLSRSACGPFPAPTVRTSDAQIHGRCSDKYKDPYG